MIFRLLFLCGLALIALSAAADDDPAAVIRTCVGNVTESVVGIEKLQQFCPGVRAAIVDLGVARRLQPEWEKSIDAEMLRDVLALHARYSESPSRIAPGIESLRNVIAGLDRDKAGEKESWWQSLLAWLRKMFAPGSSESPGWLRNLLERLSVPAAAAQIMVYVIIAIVVGLAIAVVVIELRASGLLGKRVGRGANSIDAAHDAIDGAPLRLADLDAAKWNERPAMLLRMLAGKLVELKRLPGEKSLTHRELSRRAQFPKNEDRERFSKLTALAERLRFGGEIENDPELEQSAQRTLADNRNLLGDLNAERAG